MSVYTKKEKINEINRITTHRIKAKKYAESRINNDGNKSNDPKNVA